MTAALDGTGVTVIPADTMRAALAALRGIEAPDIVNTHMSAGDLVGVRYRGGRRPRAAATAHVSTRHFGAPRGSNPFARAMFRSVGRTLSAQIAISRFVAEMIDGASEVIHTGVADAAASASGPREQTVLVAQRLEAEKHTHVALEGWARSSARAHGWTLQIAGDGAERPGLEQLCARLGVQDSVHFLGYRADVGQLMERAGMLLAPTPKEGLGLSVLEAMARALPVIAADSGGHRETAGAVPDAATFAPGDIAAVAAQLDRLATDAAARVTYGERLQRRQREEFGIAKQIQLTAGLYRRLAAS